MIFVTPMFVRTPVAPLDMSNLTARCMDTVLPDTLPYIDQKRVYSVDGAALAPPVMTPSDTEHTSIADELSTPTSTTE